MPITKHWKNIWCALWCSKIRIVQQKERQLSHVAPALKLLLQSGAKWNSDVLLDEQKTPLHIICEAPGDHHELLDLIIKSSQRKTIDTQDNSQHNALIYAVRCANMNCVKCLIANGADVNQGYDRFFHRFVPVPSRPQWNPIMEAIGMFHYAEYAPAISINIFDYLLDNGVDVNQPSCVL